MAAGIRRRGLAVQVSNPGEGELFRASPDRARGPYSFLHKDYELLPAVKAAGAWC